MARPAVCLCVQAEPSEGPTRIGRRSDRDRGVLPRVSESPSTDSASPSDGEGTALLLVVERDPHVRALESYFLNEAGFTVEFASDGHAALARARELRPDIIITEVLVPKLDGLALCRAVRADAELRDIVVLVFSILAVEARAREAGADAFLRKPLAERRLVDTVRDLLVVRRTERVDGEAS